jgi:hypothetical protein
MRTGKLRGLAALVVVVLVVAPAWSQETTPARGPSETLPPIVPPPMPPPSFPVDPAPAHAEECCACGPGGLFVSGEYLLMKPRRRALDFAIVDPIDNGVPEGSIESINWDWSSGLRVGGGYRAPGSSWEVGVFYTYLHSSDHRTLEAPDGGALYATLTHPGAIEQVAVAAGSSSLNYNVIDLEVGRHFCLGDCFEARLFGGGRAAWIDQRLHVLYDGIDANLAEVTSPIDFDGGGLRAGGEGWWKLGGGFGLFARAAGSLLVGNFRTHLTETNAAGATVIVNVSDRFEKVVPVAELGAGVAWQSQHVRLSAGYEIVNWFNLVDSPDFVDDVHQGKLGRRTGNLSLDGVTVRAEVGF